MSEAGTLNFEPSMSVCMKQGKVNESKSLRESCNVAGTQAVDRRMTDPIGVRHERDYIGRGQTRYTSKPNQARRR